MTVEESRFSSRCRAILGACAMLSASSLGVIIWSASSHDAIGEPLRELRREEQTLGHRRARLSDPQLQARLSRVAGTVDDVHLNLLETIERLNTASDVPSLKVAIEQLPSIRPGELEDPRVQELAVTIDARVLHEEAFLHLLSVLTQTAGAWPIRVDDCTLSRQNRQGNAGNVASLAVRCVLRVAHWSTPLASPNSDSAAGFSVVLRDELHAKTLFHTPAERFAFDESASVAELGLKARLLVERPSTDRESVRSARPHPGVDAASARPTDTASPRQARQSLATGRGLHPRATTGPGRAVTPIAYGGVLRGQSSTMVWINGVPCEVDNDGQVPAWCGRSASKGASANAIRRVTIDVADLAAHEPVHLRVEFADGTQARLMAGERIR